MSALRFLQAAVAVAAILIISSADFARAQSGPVVPSQGDPRTRNGVSAEQLQKLAWVRYLQGRSGGGGGNVRHGVPQFIPMGGQMPFGNMSNQGGGTQPQGQAGATDLDADQDKKSVAEKKAEYAAAREEKKRKAKERAEKRKAELAERRAKGTGN